MKKTAFLFLAAAGLIACSSADKKPAADTTKVNSTANITNNTTVTPPADTANSTTIQWMDSTFLDLGKQTEGKEIEISFRFKNTGTKPLVIKNVSAQCGCTVPQKPEQPFAPGEEGVIKAKYNGSGHGETRKEVYVTANTLPTESHTLVFRADLEK